MTVDLDAPCEHARPANVREVVLTVDASPFAERLDAVREALLTLDAAWGALPPLVRAVYDLRVEIVRAGRIPETD